ncbi:MAG: PilN domain-containing protein [Candidatus Berkelbacteria bacterium]|nr:PilN domain-containing protein [Candidatus Berkelbacteria bacterium]
MSSEEQNRLLDSVKDDITASPQKKSEEMTAFFIIGLAVAVVAGTVFVLANISSKKAKITSLDQQIASDVTAPLKTMEKESKQSDQVLAQIDALTLAVSKKVKYAQAIKDLRDNQYKNSQWTSFSFNNGKISISGNSDSFEGVSKSVVAIRQTKSVTDVKLISVNINAETQKVEFALEVTLNMDLYKTILPKASASPTTSVTPAASVTTSTGQI